MDRYVPRCSWMGWVGFHHGAVFVDTVFRTGAGALRNRAGVHCQCGVMTRLCCIVDILHAYVTHRYYAQTLSPTRTTPLETIGYRVGGGAIAPEKDSGAEFVCVG